MKELMLGSDERAAVLPHSQEIHMRWAKGSYHVSLNRYCITGRSLNRLRSERKWLKRAKGTRKSWKSILLPVRRTEGVVHTHPTNQVRTHPPSLGGTPIEANGACAYAPMRQWLAADLSPQPRERPRPIDPQLEPHLGLLPCEPKCPRLYQHYCKTPSFCYSRF
ncbi:hypothetical protein PIB30_061364 [Stylosanthes scabra]|uniref:Uncharacterized protein n=1 Tax=Stylosanthes scabra TaxID=79078 RepID=A0ABU6TLI0_9FABA|nr:hypothetical protein [Stylosanthes scabra]